MGAVWEDSGGGGGNGKCNKGTGPLLLLGDNRMKVAGYQAILPEEGELEQLVVVALGCDGGDLSV